MTLVLEKCTACRPPATRIDDLNSESSNLQHVVGRYGTAQPLKRQFPYGLGFRSIENRCADFAIDQNLTVACLRAETGGQIDYGARRAVFRSTFEIDRAERRVSVCDANSETKFVAFSTPLA